MTLDVAVSAESLHSAVRYFESKAGKAIEAVKASGKCPRRCTIDRGPRNAPERRRRYLSEATKLQVRAAHAKGRSVDWLRKEFKTSVRLIRLALGHAP